MATKGRTPKHPKPHKGVRNTDRPNGKAWKKHPKKNDTKFENITSHNTVQ